MIVGVTGGIGSGKSTVSALLERKGARIVDADRIARTVVEPGSAVLDELVEAFGGGILHEDGTLHRAELARLAFADAASTATLNAITHPAIARKVREELAALAQAPVVVLDHPLLLESEHQAQVDLIVVVSASEELRVRRLVEHRSLDAADARARIDAQMSEADRRAKADVIIDNEGSREALEAQLDALWERVSA